MSRIIALDYGQKRIGVAISDPTNKIAIGLQVIENKSSDESIFEIEKIVDKNDVAKIIIGIPLGLKNVITSQTQDTLDFLAKLKEVIHIPIDTIDERMTTKLANTFIKIKKKIKIGERDIKAAQIMLQDYLDKINN